MAPVYTRISCLRCYFEGVRALFLGVAS